MLLCLVVSARRGWSQGTIIASETDAQAALIYQLTRFTEWPVKEEPAREAPAPLVLVVAGDRALGEALTKIVEGKVIDGQPLEVHLLSDRDPLPEETVVLYVNSAKDWRRIAKDLKDRPILCMGELRSFLKWGGDILLTRRDGHLAFSVQLDHLRQKGLDLNSQVLQLAHEVHYEEDS